MSDSPVRCLCWRVIDYLDYALTLARFRILDALAGPEPETPADQRRKQDRERIERAFPSLDGEEPGAAVSHRADRHQRDD
jgi:hypothetical protein